MIRKERAEAAAPAPGWHYDESDHRLWVRLRAEGNALLEVESGN
jgi:hypothetical protein